MRAASVVQVHLGETLPLFVYDQLRQTRLFNPGTAIFLIVKSGTALDRRALDELGVSVARLECFRACENHRRFRVFKSLDPRYWKIFWRSASERFFVIESFMKATGLKAVAHLENDVLLYTGLDRLLPVLSSRYGHIALTMDNDWRCIPGFVYIQDEESLSRMNESVVRIPVWKRFNDMQALGAFMSGEGPPACDSLPVVPAGYRERFGFRSVGGEVGEGGFFDRNFAEFGGVFDAAALGQYLGGVAAETTADSRGFVNEAAVYDPRNLGLGWESVDGRMVPFGSLDGEKFQVFNLHIHSKNLRPFMSDRRT